MSLDDNIERYREMSLKDEIEFHCIKQHETDNAILVVDPDTGEEIWFPLSQVRSMHFDGKGVGYMVITAWIADKKGLDIER